MFQNNLQSSTYLDLFDPNMPSQKIKNIFKLEHVNGNNKIHDKEVKSNIFAFSHRHSQIVFPKNQDNDLSLTQRFLNLQIQFFAGMNWSLELAISDQNRIKRRVIFSSSIHTLQKKPFYIKSPCGIQEGYWNNFIIDLYSFIRAFPNQQYHSLDSIHITGFFKLRRIFTTQNMINFSNIQQSKQEFIPKNFYFPPQLKHLNYFLEFNEIPQGQKLQQSEVSTRNQSFNKKRQIKTTKLPKLESKFLYKSKQAMNQKYKILQNMQNQIKNHKNNQLKLDDQISANRLGKHRTLKTSRKLKQHKIQNQSKQKQSWSSKKIFKKRDIPIKNTAPLKQLINDIKSCRTALTIPIKENKQKIFNTMESQVKSAQIQCTRIESKNDSDSEYLEKSSKFSSYFQSRPMTRNQTPYILESFNDYIEQDIQLQDSLNFNEQMQKNNKKQTQPKLLLSKRRSVQQKYIIKNDQYMNEKNMREKKQKSTQGFGEKLINKYMKELERPYSPPLVDYIQEVSEKQQQQQQKNQLQVIYDPILECYYDCKTQTYYKLKE